MRMLLARQEMRTLRSCYRAVGTRVWRPQRLLRPSAHRHYLHGLLNRRPERATWRAAVRARDHHGLVRSQGWDVVSNRQLGRAKRCGGVEPALRIVGYQARAEIDDVIYVRGVDCHVEEVALRSEIGRVGRRATCEREPRGGLGSLPDE